MIDLDATRWQEIRQHFEALLRLRSRDQSAALARIGATDPEMGSALAALLAADEESSGLLRISSGGSGGRAASQGADLLGHAGRTISHFRVLRPIGAGGMGVVYEAEDTRLGRAVALKFPLPQYLLDESSRQRFLQEARAAAALDHPNLCTIYEVGALPDGQLFLAMALYRGETLRARLARLGALEIGEAVEIARQTALGLACAHAAGIVHRDLKPGNLMLLPDGTVRILDFGLAKTLGWGGTTVGAAVGTVPYMAPEQVRGRAVSPATDLWALGVVLYEMLTGARPFVGENEFTVAQGVLEATPLPPSARRPEVGAELEALVNRLLRRGGDESFSKAAELARELSALTRPSSVEAHTPDRHPRWRPIPRWRRRPLLLAAVAAAMGTAALAIYALREDASASPDDRRVVVAVFENQTGDSSLAPLGRLAAASISQGLSELGYLEVRDAEMIPGIWSDSGYSPALVARLVEGTAAGTLVKGSYSLEGDSIRLVAQITDADDGRVLQRVGPISTPISAPHEGIDQLVSTVMGGAALIFDPQTSPWEARSRRRVPTFEAYRAYSAGLDAYQMNDWLQSAAHFERAFEVDTTFVGAAIWAALSRMLITWGMGGISRDEQVWNLARADSIAAEVERRLTRLEQYDRHFFDWYLSLRYANYDGAYVAATRMLDVAPGSYVALKEAAWGARRGQRPREALELLQRLGLENGLLRSSASYWWELVSVTHRLGDYDREIAYARMGRQVIPLWSYGTVAEVRAHAAAGRIDTAAWIVNERAGTLDGVHLLEIAVEFSTHGFDREARSVLGLVEPWVASRTGDVRNSEAIARIRADALYMLGDYAGARREYEARSWSQPLYWFVKGRLGLIAIEEGDTLTARRLYAELLADTPLLPQRDWPLFMARAGLAARVSNLEEAAAHARELLWTGGWERLHFFPELAPLRSYPPVQAMMRPSG